MNTLLYVELIEKEEDQVLFDEIYSKYKKQMLYVSNSILHDQYEAEDAAHNALIGIAKNIATVRALDSYHIGSYVLTSAYHSALNLLRKKQNRKAEKSIDTLYTIQDVNYFEKIQIREQYEEVVEAIQSLKAIYREVLTMHYVFELSTQEIGRVLNRKNRTVEQQILRGKKMLLKLLLDSDLITKSSGKNNTVQ